MSNLGRRRPTGRVRAKDVSQGVFGTFCRPVAFGVSTGHVPDVFGRVRDGGGGGTCSGRVFFLSFFLPRCVGRAMDFWASGCGEAVEVL